jgi:protoheme IX farnesyltransferase
VNPENPNSAHIQEIVPPGVRQELLELTKARLNVLVLVTTFVGYWLGSPWPIDVFRLICTVIGTGLAAASAGALNQALEYRHDQLMARTAERPVAAGRMTVRFAYRMGAVLGILGVGLLAIKVSWLTAGLAAGTIAVYVAVYTPMKRHTDWCVLVGAVAGALPPVVGWSAVQPLDRLNAWVLFGILFSWQMPHFLAIAWMYRAEYAKAGFVMLRRTDESGTHTAWLALANAVLLAFVSILPFAMGLHQSFYLGIVLLMNCGFFLCAVMFLMDRSRPSARRLFFASIIYLPAVLILLIVTKP